MIDIPKDYFLQKFLSNSPNATRNGNCYQSSCIICKEGNSYLRKKRARFILDKNYVFCHNCNKNYTPFSWLNEALNMSFLDIIKELKDTDLEFYEKLEENNSIYKQEKINDVLPKDYIDLTNDYQKSFYKNNKIIQSAIKTIKERKLDIAINSPNKFFISLNDEKYKNRLIIPYFNFSNEINYYTARSLLKDQDPKYLNKFGEKQIFNLNKIDSNIPYIFIFEGQIDSMFVKNGIAVSGLQLTQFQKNQLLNYKNHEIIYILDNPHLDKASKEFILKNKTLKYYSYQDIKEYKCKDINEYCIKKDLNEFDYKNILDNTKYGESLLFTI